MRANLVFLYTNYFSLFQVVDLAENNTNILLTELIQNSLFVKFFVGSTKTVYDPPPVLVQPYLLHPYDGSLSTHPLINTTIKIKKIYLYSN